MEKSVVVNQNILKRLQCVREESVNACYRQDDDKVQELRLEQLRFQKELLKGGLLHSRESRV